jgi:hypothetical protein
MSRARHLVLAMAAGALAGVAAGPAGAAPATGHLRVMATTGGQLERVDSDDSHKYRRYRDDDRNYGHYDRPYRYRDYDRPYRHRYYDYPYGYRYSDHPYGYRYYDYPYRGYGFYAPGFVFRFGLGKHGFDRD